MPGVRQHGLRAAAGRVLLQDVQHPEPGARAGDGDGRGDGAAECAGQPAESDLTRGAEQGGQAGQTETETAGGRALGHSGR